MAVESVINEFSVFEHPFVLGVFFQTRFAILLESLGLSFVENNNLLTRSACAIQ